MGSREGPVALSLYQVCGEYVPENETFISKSMLIAARLGLHMLHFLKLLYRKNVMRNC